MDKFVLFAVLALAGAFGGFVRFVVENKGGHTLKVFFKEVAFGVAAALLLPLFGELLSDLGKLVAEAHGLVLVGFALLAGLFGKKFVNKVAALTVEEKFDDKEGE